MHLLETADEWPFLKEAVATEEGATAGDKEQQQSSQERLFCDMLMGEPFYYRVRRCLLRPYWEGGVIYGFILLFTNLIAA